MRSGIEVARGRRGGGRRWGVLLGGGDAARVEHAEEPAYFGDLNLDQIVAAIAYRREAYELPPFFYAPLCDVEAIRFRQQVFSDLERPEVREFADAFAALKLVERHRSE